MILREVIPILIACACLSPIAAAQKVSPSPPTIPPSSTVEHTQDFSEVVVPITSVKITPSVKLSVSGKQGPRLGPKPELDADFGTGFCLDAACRFIVTNYHVAMIARAGKVKGEKIVQRYFATGPNDKGATANNVGTGDALPYVMKRDLAMFELGRSLSHHHGLSYNLDELQVGQEVDIYGYPHGIINPFRKLTRFPATFKAPTTSGLLAFDFERSGDNSIRRKGASGGIVVDRKTEKIVGILTGGNDAMAVAVPVQALVDFVSKVQPFVAARIFPTTKNISPVSADLYPKFAPSPDYNPKYIPGVAFGLQRRPEEPYEVSVLRKNAQRLADSMRNFIAVANLAWGWDNREPAAEAQFEVRVIDGEQRFRDYPDGKKELTELPFLHLKGSVNPIDEWSRLPTMVGTEFRLKVRQAADVVVNEQQMKVFQYYASAEDNLCTFQPVEDFLFFFRKGKLLSPACYGEVWTDKDTNILRMSEHYDLSDRPKGYQGWEDCQTVLTYGWLKRADEPSRLIPLTGFNQGRNGKHLYWTRSHFTDYQIFSSRVKILAKDDRVQNSTP